MRVRLPRAVLVVGAAAALTAAGTTAAGPPVTPQPISTGGTVVFTRTTPPSPGSASTQAAGAIYCNMTVDYPHASGHNPGQANVESHVTCDGIVSSIGLTTKLFRAGIQVASNPAYATGTFFLNGQANATCLTARYGGSADTLITAPPGYTPVSARLHVDGAVVQVNC